MKQFTEKELLVVTQFTLQAKISNGTMDNKIFESVEIAERDGKSELVIHFVELPLCFAVEEDKLYEAYAVSGYSLYALVIKIINNAVKEYNMYAGVLNEKDATTSGVMDIRNIYFQIMPFDTEYFADKPTIRLAFDPNLCVLFRCYVSHSTDTGVISIPITHEIYQAVFSNYSLEEFFELARYNAARLFKINTCRMDRELRCALTMRGYSEEAIQKYLKHISIHQFLHLVTTDVMLYGANALVMPEILQDFAKKIGGSFYILPGSQRELYFASEKNPNGSNWKETVVSANAASDQSEVLSNHVYFYDATTGQISIVK